MQQTNNPQAQNTDNMDHIPLPPVAPVEYEVKRSAVRTMVRGVYDLQKIRIQMGNRITAQFKTKLGMQQNGMTEAQLEREQKRLLDDIRMDYNRLTDGVVTEGEERIKRLPKPKKFVPGPIISDYIELVLVDQYMAILKDEERNFRQLDEVLKAFPLYTEFLSNVRGIGPAIAAIIISEIDIYKSTYPSSLCAYAGLDVVTYGRIKDDKDVYQIVPSEFINEFYDTREDENAPMIFKGKVVEFVAEGRSKKEQSLVDRLYTDREGVEKSRKSITFNPFLKTKLVGVLGSSFLRAVISTVDGNNVSAAGRLALAKEEGFKLSDDAEDDDVAQQVIEYLRMRGHHVVVERAPYAKVYYDYKERLENMPKHADKTPLHRHNMAMRYMIKQFLKDLYNAWRPLENLIVVPPYEEAKLGLVHGQASAGKAKQQ